MKIEIVTSADNNPVAEYFSSSSTPETDAAWSCFKGYMEPLQDVKDLCRKLERERDEAREECDKLKQLLAADSERVDAYLGVCIERDEARGALHNYQCDAVAWEILTKAKHERDRLREVVIQTLNANRHLADGDNCTLAILKSAVPEWK